MIKGNDITIASIHLDFGFNTDHIMNFKILRYLGRNNNNCQAWMGRLKNGKGVFVSKFKTKIKIQDIINW